MLSRRHLRIKVFQALYSLQSAREADYEMALDFIAEAFKPDLNSMLPQDAKQLESFREAAFKLLEKSHRKGDLERDDQTPAPVYVTAKNALMQFQKRVKEDQSRLERRLIPEVESIYDTYLFVLQVFMELGGLSKIERDRQYEDFDGPKLERLSGFDTNRVVVALKESKVLEAEIIRKGIGWNDEKNTFVRQLFRDIFRNDETYRAYCAQMPSTHSEADDQALMEHAFKNVLFKNKETVEFLEKLDLYWNETSDIVRKMTQKTLKSVTESGELELVPLTDSWEDDQFFMEELFKKTIEQDQEFEEIIAEPLKNWDVDRLASTDNLILKMALAEMMTFSGIPTKVTINEAIELAKEYSTPKSGKFVNGILDTVSKSLIKDGKIRKSGRGLMDNK